MFRTIIPHYQIHFKQIYLLIALLISTSAVAQSDFYVSTTNGNDANSGNDFSNAYATLQKALEEAETAGPGSRIYVAAGIYKPSQGWDIPTSSLPTKTTEARHETFKIPDGVEVYGGFADTEAGTVDQAILDARDFTANKTTLSGDLDNDNLISSADAYHVVFTKNVSSTTLVDGFTITGGNANAGFPNNYGGGWYNDGNGSGNASNPTLRNCSFVGNAAAEFGGGMYNRARLGGNSNPNLNNCSFINNNSASDGGGMYNDGYAGLSSPTLIDCSFTGNVAQSSGGGICNFGSSGISSPVLTNCRFSNNTAYRGGGMYNIGKNSGGVSSPVLTNCIITGNTANYQGGGISNIAVSGGTSSPTLSNCSFVGNTATSNNGGGIYNSKGYGTMNLQIRNCIFWDNTAANGDSWTNDGSLTDVAYTLVEEASSGGLSGGTNTNGDLGMTYGSNPLFTNAASGDLTLQAGSPARDAGNNDDIPAGITTDATGTPRIQNGTVDMGALEFTLSLYVKASANGGSDANSGTDFSNAYATLQKALEEATAFGEGAKIYVAAGTYKPSQEWDIDTGAISTGDVRSISFKIPDGVKVYGGFPANASGTVTSADIEARNLAADISTLSGDIGNIGDHADNAYHVVFTKNASPSTLVDGFTITAGNANTGAGQGGGWYNNGSESGNISSPTLQNCIFVENTATSLGGAMYNNGARGNASPKMTNCRFSRNTTGYLAGGIYFYGDEGSVASTLINCVFDGNSDHVGYDDGHADTQPTFTNCTFVGATQAVVAINYWNSGKTPLDFINCIFWDNASMKIGHGTGTLNITHSIIEDNTYSGTGNLLNQDPLFTDAAAGNFTLQPCSPAIDAGNNSDIPAGLATDAAGNPRMQNGTVDMGALEATPTPLPKIDFTAGTTDFDDVLVGNDSTLNYTVNNSGSAVLNIAGITSDNALFVVQNAPATVAAGNSATFDVLFSPTAEGAATANITINSDDCDEPSLSFAVNGTGLATITWTGTAWIPHAPTGTESVVIDGPNAPTNFTAQNLTINDGSTLSLVDGETLTIQGSLTNNGTFTQTGGTVTFSGTSAQTVSGTSTTSFSQVEVDNANGLTLNSGVEVTQKLTLTNGTLTTNDNLTLKSTQDNTAYIVYGTGSTSGNVTMERIARDNSGDLGLYAGTGRRFISSPVNNTTVGTITGFTPILSGAATFNTDGAATLTAANYPNIFAYNETRIGTSDAFGKGWYAPEDATDNLSAGVGFSLEMEQNTVVSFNGPLNSGQIDVTVTNNEGNADFSSGWHLIGNPYPSPISLKDFMMDNNSVLFGTAFVRYPSGRYTGEWGSYVASSGISSPANIVANDALAPMQSFMVYKSTTTPGTASFTESHRIDPAGFNVLRTEAAHRGLIRLQLKNGERFDEAVVYLHENGSKGFDTHYDAFMVGYTQGNNLFLEAGEQQLKINAVSPDKEISMPLGVWIAEAGEQSFELNELSGWDSDLDAYLEDRETGELIELAEGTSYTFQAEKGWQEGRFRLHLGTPKSKDALEQGLEIEGIHFFAYGKTIALEAEDGKPVRLSLYSLTGVKLLEQEFQGGQRLQTGLPTGIYLLKAETGEGSAVKRVKLD